MRAFRAGQIESGKMPPYIGICSRASRISWKTYFFQLKKGEAGGGQSNFVKKIQPVRLKSFQSFILHSMCRFFPLLLVDDEKILCRYYIRHNGRFTIEGFDVHCTCTTNEKDQTFLSIDLPFVKTRSPREK